MKKEVRKFSMLDKIGYTLGDMGCCCTEQFRSAYLSVFYTLVLQVNPAHSAILFLITRHFNILLQIKELKGQNRNDVAKKVGVPPFAVQKYMSQADNFTKQGLIENLKDCAEMEAQVKTGLMTDQMTVELLIVKFSQR